MNTNLLTQKPSLALSLLGLEYLLLGWYLAAHNIFWLVGTLLLITMIALIRKKSPVLEVFSQFFTQGFVTVIGISLFVSLVVTLTLTNPILLSLILLPLITWLYALIELRAANFTQSDIWIWSVIITILGLGIGEAIDLFLMPSMRY